MLDECVKIKLKVYKL